LSEEEIGIFRVCMLSIFLTGFYEIKFSTDVEEPSLKRNRREDNDHGSGILRNNKLIIM